jgi:hypothetical protein
VRSIFLCYCDDSADPPIVYAEKAEAEASKDALKFNCAQRKSFNHFMLSTVIHLPHYRRSSEHPREHTAGAC